MPYINLEFRSREPPPRRRHETGAPIALGDADLDDIQVKVEKRFERNLPVFLTKQTKLLESKSGTLLPSSSRKRNHRLNPKITTEPSPTRR